MWYLLIISIILLGATNAEFTSFSWHSCTKDTSNQALKVLSASVQPMPVLIPGPLTVSFSAEILKQIDVALLDFNFTRHTAFGDVHIPCAAGVGSCKVDGCSLVTDLINGAREGQRDLGNQLKAMFGGIGVPITCPIHKQNITVTNFQFHLSALSSALSVFTDGDYYVAVTVKEPATNRELGCFAFQATLKAKHEETSGWLLGRRRRRR